MKRRVICIAATALCMAMTSMAYAKEIETTTEDDETYYTLEVKRKPYDIEKIASVVLGEDYQRDKEYERYWYNEEGTLEDEIEHVEYYKTGYYRAYPMFGYSNWKNLIFPTVRFLHILWESKVLKRWIWTLLHQAIQK